MKTRADAPYRINVGLTTKTSYTAYTMTFSEKINFDEKLTQFVLADDRHNRLPENGAALILKELLKKKALISAEFPAGFLSEQQNAVLQLHININKRNQDSKRLRVENREKQSKRRWAVLGTALVIGVAILTGLSYWLAICASVVAGYISYNLKTILLARNKYQDQQSIQTCSPEEKEALKLGVEAQAWPGYFNSFTHWQTYRHWPAFSAGMQHAEQENAKMVRTIRANI